MKVFIHLCTLSNIWFLLPCETIVFRCWYRMLSMLTTFKSTSVCELVWGKLMIGYVLLNE